MESVQQVKSKLLGIAYNISFVIDGPSRMTMLIAPGDSNLSIEFWGFKDVHLIPPELNPEFGVKPHYFIQFIQGLKPR